MNTTINYSREIAWLKWQNMMLEQELDNKYQLPVSRDEHETIKNPFVVPGIKWENFDSKLNTDQTFANFIEGECNKMARYAGLSVSNNPCQNTFNPLFVFGNCGLGKTHLIHAIGNKIKELHRDKLVLYVPSIKFHNQFLDSIRNNTRNHFINFYQSLDVLIIDDIQDLIAKDKTQEALLHIVSEILSARKQIIITSDKDISELSGVIENRLLSRCKWGLMAELVNPDLITRIEILKHKYSFPTEIIQNVASHSQLNIRELEGIMVSLLAHATPNENQITTEQAADFITKIVKTTKKEITVEYVQKVVCNYFNVPVEMLQDNTRKREIVQARQIAMFFSKSLTKSSLSVIGSQIGDKDHATVLHACKTVNNLIDTDKRFRAQIEEIEGKLKG